MDLMVLDLGGLWRLVLRVGQLSQRVFGLTISFSLRFS